MRHLAALIVVAAACGKPAPKKVDTKAIACAVTMRALDLADSRVRVAPTSTEELGCEMLVGLNENLHAAHRTMRDTNDALDAQHEDVIPSYAVVEAFGRMAVSVMDARGGLRCATPREGAVATAARSMAAVLADGRKALIAAGCTQSTVKSVP